MSKNTNVLYLMNRMYENLLPIHMFDSIEIK